MNAKTGTCIDCHLRPIDNSVSGPRLCTTCLEYADIEVMHMDYDDDERHSYGGIKRDGTDCPVCWPEFDKRYTKKTATTRVDQAKTTHRSHAGCGHATTPAARAICRKAGGPKA